MRRLCSMCPSLSWCTDGHACYPPLSSLQTGQYSTQIFSLAVLLSSLFVFNQMGGIDEAALDRCGGAASTPGAGSGGRLAGSQGAVALLALGGMGALPTVMSCALAACCQAMLLPLLPPRLSLVTEMTKHIRVRASGGSDVSTGVWGG